MDCPVNSSALLERPVAEIANSCVCMFYVSFVNFFLLCVTDSAEHSLRGKQLLSLSRNCQYFMKTEGLLLCFQQRATSPIFSQINVSHSVPLCSFEINFIIVLHLRGTFNYQELQKTSLIFDL